jgi:hypothetical protein
MVEGPQWQGNYLAAGGESVMRDLLAENAWLPRAIVCTNDQTTFGVMHQLARHSIDVPGDLVLPTRLVRRQSFGCAAAAGTAAMASGDTEEGRSCS